MLLAQDITSKNIAEGHATRRFGLQFETICWRFSRVGGSAHPGPGYRHAASRPVDAADRRPHSPLAASVTHWQATR